MRTFSLPHIRAVIRTTAFPIAALFVVLAAISYFESRQRIEVLVEDVSLVRDEFRGYSLSIEQSEHFPEGKFLVLSRPRRWGEIFGMPIAMSLFIFAFAALRPNGEPK